jgi:hypothetical protein
VQYLGNQVLLLITAIHGKNPAAALRAPSVKSAPPLTNSIHPEKQPSFARPGTAVPVNLLASGGGASRALPDQPGLASATPVTLTQGSSLIATLLQQTTALSNRPPTNQPHILPQLTAADLNKIASTDTGLVTSKIDQSGPMATSFAGQTKTGNTIVLGAGTPLIIKVLSVQPGNIMPQAITATQPIKVGGILDGTVSNTGISTQTVVGTQVGQIALNTTTPLPVGTKVEFQIIEIQPTDKTPPNSLANERLGQIIVGTGQWPTLQETVQFLSEANPVTAQQLLNSILPRLDAAFAANILTFLLTLRTGDIRHWLGDAPTRALTQLKPALLRRLRDDFSGLKRIAEESPSTEGRLFSIPLSTESQIEQIRLWLHRQNEDTNENEEGRKKPGVRFVIEINLSRLGRVQLDGFVEDENKRFHLIIRSDNRLNDDIQQGIRTVFENANESIGVSCGLAFQSAPANFIEIARGLNEKELGLIV